LPASEVRRQRRERGGDGPRLRRPDCSKCPVGDECAAGSDCESLVCILLECASPTCADVIANGDETDVDCGGMCPQKCATGKGCGVNVDCKGSLCSGGPVPADVHGHGEEPDGDGRRLRRRELPEVPAGPDVPARGRLHERGVRGRDVPGADVLGHGGERSGDGR
jgi:hypothetical protein